jgi:malonate decarboxylase beta subunit
MGAEIRPQASFSELSARERSQAVLDPGTFRELLGPFAHVESPHLEVQGIVPQSDDGVVVARGMIAGVEAVVISIEGGFQGGSIGEVSGEKIAGSLELALRDAGRGRMIRAVILFETGGIRVQEANLGILALSEIHSAILALREYVPVVGVIAGKIGCFGGMGIAAGLCSVLIGTELGRLGLNGPEVIEQEAGITELDSRDRARVWQTIGCKRRLETGHIDHLVPDSVDALAAAIRLTFERGVQTLRSANIDAEVERIRKYEMPEASYPEAKQR